MALLDLSLQSSVISIIGLLVLCTIVHLVGNYRKLKQFDGPAFAKVSELWLMQQSYQKSVYPACKQILKQYGSPARIGPNMLVTSDPDVLRHMSAVGSKWRRSEWYTATRFDPRADTVFSTRDEKVHAMLKSKETGGYSGRDNPCLESDIDECTQDLLELVDSYHGKSFDLAPAVKWYTLDMLSQVAFGRKFGYMAAKDDLWGYIAFGHGFNAIIELCMQHYWIRRILTWPPIAALTAPKVTDATGMGPVLAFARKAVAERWEGAVERKDMLDSFKNKGLDRVQMEAEANLQIVAGGDSTTTVLRCILYAVMGTPAVYVKLQREVDGIDSASIIKYSDAQKLPYLVACVWEGIRMYPPLFAFATKKAPPEGDTINGVYYPGGVEVVRCDEATMRREDIFGEDAHVYRPERWLDIDQETKVKYTRVVDLAFGAGRFLCLGKHIAMMGLHKALFELFRRYDWQMTDPLRGIDWIQQGVHLQSNMNVIATVRA